MMDDADTVEALKAEVTRLNRLATDQRYMMDAYRNMLGPKALEVAAKWDAKRVHRVHYDWGPKAAEMTGEERAAIILQWEAAPRQAMLPGEIDGHLTPQTSP